MTDPIRIDDRLNQAAEQIGSRAGRAVQAIRGLPERLQHAGSSVADEKPLYVVAGAAIAAFIAGAALRVWRSHE